MDGKGIIDLDEGTRGVLEGDRDLRLGHSLCEVVLVLVDGVRVGGVGAGRGKGRDWVLVQLGVQVLLGIVGRQMA